MAGTYWLTVLPDTSKLMPQLKRTLKDVDITPRVDEKSATASGKRFGQRFGGAASSAIAGIGAKLGGALLSGQAIKKVLTTGNELTKTLNTLQGVSGATADVMAKVSDRARELGADVTLPATSAAKAAAAMTELAKGGLSVDQAMVAAKGTLALAAAAGTDAATAATIQANALNTFGKKADFASKASDILAAAANASSVEISDVAQGLQQGGAVAAQYGISMKDTAAAIGVLGNAGIKGSDAGTLLKSALLALANPSRKAQGALDEMGVTAFDAQGNFVGLSTIFEQLQDASKRLTPEMYAQDAAMAFGSDAARLAGVAARQGGEGFDAMVTAVDKNGAALTVAKANMKGLPGAWEKFQNSIEDVSLTIYDLIKGPLKSLLGMLTTVFGFLGEHKTIVSVVFGGAAAAIGTAVTAMLAYKTAMLAVTVATKLWTIATTAATIATRAWAVANTALGMASMVGQLGLMATRMVAYKVATLAVSAATKIWAGVQTALNLVMSANPIGLIIVAIAALAAGIIYAYKHSETFRNIVNSVWDAIKVGISWVGDKMTWLWHEVFVPAWNGIKAAVTTGWNALKGIFNTVKSVVSTVGDAFSTAFGTIKRVVQDAWNTIGGIIDKISSGVGKVGNVLSHIPGLGFLGGHAQGGLVGHAAGGRIRGPGTGTSDSVLYRGSNGEFVINARSTAKHLALIEAINADALPGFAAGGLVDPRARGMVGTLAGTPYQMGGFSPTALDCSGGVSAVVNSYLGLPMFDSRMSTPSEGSWLQKRGAQPGRGGLGDLTVLWWDGGSGGFANGHTMAVLPDGTTFESGGLHHNTALGDTTSPNDPQWTHAAHFPKELLMGALNPQGSGRGSGGGGRRRGGSGGSGSGGSIFSGASGGAGGGSSFGATGGGQDAKKLGGLIVSGMKDELGGVLSSPLDWPNVKSGMAALNFLGGALGGGKQGPGGGGGFMGGIADAVGLGGLFTGLSNLAAGGSSPYTPHHPGDELTPGLFNPVTPGNKAPKISAPKSHHGDSGGVVNDNRTIFNGNVDGDVSRAMSEQHKARIRRTRTTKVGG